MARRKEPFSDLVVRLEDTYNPANFVMVHKTYYDGMRDALREAHKRINDEWGGDTSGCVCVYCAPSVQPVERP